MRHDMAKVVTESPRRGHSERNHKSRAKVLVKAYDEDGDYGPRKLKMGRHVREGRGYAEGKEFSDLLGPLRKYLRKQVGRPWDKVYSELREHLDFRTVSGLHIWDHVQSEVAIHCEERDGEIYFSPGAKGGFSNLYVHPRTRLLCYGNVRGYRWGIPYGFPRQRREVDVDVVKIDKFAEYRRIDGIWYFCKYGVVDRYHPPVKSKYRTFPEKWVEEFVLQSKKQLSRAELKAAGLKNSIAA